MSEPDARKSESPVPGLAIAGCLLTGAAGLIQSYRTDDSMNLIASSLAFGIVAYLSFKQ